MQYEVPLKADLSKYSLPRELEHIKNCQKCPLAPGKNYACTQVVLGSGNLNAKVLILGEAPGQGEDHYGFPMVNQAHWILEELEKRGITQRDYFLTNSVWCRPPENRVPKKRELDACRHNLSELISKMSNLKLVLTLGSTAMKVIEGESSLLSLRVGIGAWVEWMPSGGGQIRKLYNVPLKHPVSLAYVKNDFARDRAYAEYLSQLNFFYFCYENVDKLENIEKLFPYDYKFCLTEDECREAVQDLKTQAEAKYPDFHLGVDFETSKIMTAYGKDILCIAIAYEDFKAYVLPFNQFQLLEKDSWFKTIGRNGNPYTQRGKVVPWHDDPNFNKELAELLRPLLDAEIMTGYKFKPMITAHNLNFEINTGQMNWGYPILPRKDQIVDPSRALQDTMTAFRIANNSLHKVSLDALVHYMSPIEGSGKDAAQWVLENYDENFKRRSKPSKRIIEETGFAWLALKGRKEEYYVPEYEQYRQDILFWRACFDACVERRLSYRIHQLLMSPDESLFFDYLKDLSLQGVFLDED